MRKYLLLFVAVGLAISGCSHVEVKTIKRDRVDQEVKGNEGYLQGESGQVTKTDRPKQRTIINFDVNLTDEYLGEEDKKEAVKASQIQAAQKESSKVETAVKNEPVESAKDEQIVKTVVVEASGAGAEENWIK